VGLTKRVVLNLTAGRMGSFLSISALLKRERIRDGYVARDVREDDRIFWRDGIELLPIRESFFRTTACGPIRRGDPFAFLVLEGDCGGDALLHFLRGGHTRERDGEFVSGGATEMHMGIVEARHHETGL